MHVAAAIEDPGAANGLIGLTDALAEKRVDLKIYATGPAVTYAPTVELAVKPFKSLKLPFGTGEPPSAILTGTSENPKSPVFDVTAAALAADIPSFGFVDGPANAEYRFRGNTDYALAHAPEFLLVSDPAAKDAFVGLGVNPAKIDVVGHPAMDRVRARRVWLDFEGRGKVRARLFPEIDPARPLVMFLAETSDGLDPSQFRRSSDYTLDGRGGRDGRTEICLEETIDALAGAAPEAALVLKLHPKNVAATFEPYAADLAAVGIGVDPLEAVYAADLVIGMTSVLLFEAAVMGRPTIAVTPRASEAAWLSSIGLGLTKHVCSSGDLRASINEALTGGLTGIKKPDEVVPAGAAARIADAICRRIKT